MNRSDQFALGLISGVILMMSVGGCASARWPAIDPSGQHIFLPEDNSPTDSPQISLGLPRPAFTTPATPPDCPPGETSLAAADAQPTLAVGIPAPPQIGQAGSLTLTPTRMVAPVGSEVVLMSGVVGGNGRYIPRHHLEWTLSQDSVGHFVEVGDELRGFFQRLFPSGSRKLSNSYAIGRTSTRATVIRRGTTSPTDDVWLPQGQSWISVTSATEGVSYVTVLTPNAATWELRRQTAKIHWIDAQWQLPSTAIVQRGQNHALTTIVAKASDGVGVPGWLVRYEIIDEAITGFAPQGDSVIEILTDSTGSATVELLAPPQGGTVQVQVQIIRPAMATGDLPQTVVGQGWASVTWSAAGLAVRATGPTVAEPGDTLEYRVEVSNPGDMVAGDTTLSATLPPTISFINSFPLAQVFGERIEWQLGDLAPGGVSVVNIKCRAEQRGDVRFCVKAGGADGLKREDCVDTHIKSSSLTVEMTGPQTVQVGQEAQFKIEISNRGDTPLTGVNITDRYDAGLEHSEGQQSPMARSLGELAAGEVRRIAVTFIVRREGRLCHSINVTADNGESVDAESCLTATAAASQPISQPEMRLRVVGPESQQVGDTGEYRFELANTGNVTLTDLSITDRYPESQQPDLATEGYHHETGKMVWTIASLEPGESVTRQVNCRALRPDPAAIHRVSATAAPNLSSDQQMTTEIFALRSEPTNNDNDTSGDPTPVSGELQVTVADQNDPILVGGNTTYFIIVKNDRIFADKEISLTILLPRGMKFVKLTGPTGTRGVSSDGRTINVTPVAEMRPGESLAPYRLEVQAELVGKLKVSVKVNSLRSAAEVQADEDTTVLVE